MDRFALSMPHWPKPTAQAPGTPAERTRSLLAKLNHPEHRLPPVVHVGGTKGKGSTIAFLRAMLEAAGYRVHVYTSPHLHRFNERIVIAGKEVSDDALYTALETTRLAAGEMEVGFFDATTAAAMLLFSQTPADILLMEMGLGGEVDATNIIDHPLLTILTTVSFDHMEFMGDTLPDIMRFEAGLLKPGAPCIVSYQPEAALPTLYDAATKIGAPLYEYAKHWHCIRRDDNLVFADNNGEAQLPLPNLLGPHQIINAGNAIAAVSALLDFDIAPEHIAYGLTHAVWKGRLEQMRSMNEFELWFDGGHNPAAADAIAQFIEAEWRDKPLYLIFGTTRGKDVKAMLAPLLPLVDSVYGVSVKSEPNSYSPKELQTHMPEFIPADSLQDALEMIKQKTSAPFRALVFGSLYLWLEASQL